MPRTQVRWRITPRRNRWRRWTSLRRSGPYYWDDDNDDGDDDDDDNDDGDDDDDQEYAMALIKAESQIIKNDWENNGNMLLLYLDNPNLSEIQISSVRFRCVNIVDWKINTHWKLETGARINRNEHHIQFPVRERWALFRNQKSKCEIKLNNAEITKLELVLIDFYKSGSGGNLLFFHDGQGSFSSLQTQENGKQRRIDEVWILIVTPGEFTMDTLDTWNTQLLFFNWHDHD